MNIHKAHILDTLEKKRREDGGVEEQEVVVQRLTNILLHKTQAQFNVSLVLVEKPSLLDCLFRSQAIHSYKHSQGSGFLRARPFLLPPQGQLCSVFGEGCL